MSPKGPLETSDLFSITVRETEVRKGELFCSKSHNKMMRESPLFSKDSDSDGWHVTGMLPFAITWFQWLVTHPFGYCLRSLAQAHSC